MQSPAFDIHVQTAYLADQSAPEREVFAFSYTITIVNRSDAPAQLIARHWLIDEVAPNDDALWALRRLSCQRDTLCTREAQELIDQAMANIDAGQRAEQVSEAEAVLARYTPFIALAAPLRWSVAAQRLTGLRANPRASHPLNRMIAAPKLLASAPVGPHLIGPAWPRRPQLPKPFSTH